MKRDDGTEQFWRKTVAEARRRKGTVREFCQERGLKESRLYFWQRELKTQEAGAAHNSGFVELVGPAEAGSGAGVCVRIGDQIDIILDRGFDTQTLTTALACLLDGAHGAVREGRVQ